MAKLSRLSRAGLAKETTLGQALTPTFYIPWETFEPEDLIPPIRDESVRANDTVLQNVYGGAASSTVALGGKLYPDLAGHLLRAMGLVDTVGAPSGSLYPHTMKSTGAQPPTYTITDDDNLTSSARAYPGQMLNELTINIDTAATDAVKYDSKWMGYPSAAAASLAGPTYSTSPPFLGWQTSFSAAATASDRIMTAQLAFKREVEVIPGSDGTQGPRETFGAGIEYDITATALFENQVELDRFLTFARVATVLTLTKPAGVGGESLALTSTGGVWQKAAKKRGSKYVTLDFAVSGTYSATDAGPVAAVLSNLISAQY